ncbi:unnamed protein product [Schistosoma margrebowiei]|uniref:Ubiquitin carboxyl-terminal hydrolase n=1 Tax=Schistosoma margrebowiei TaxID=48269 RepID=A0AA85AHH0_9TREM|nr:unnamed protein product [Schistosoma margrebowiei]
MSESIFEDLSAQVRVPGDGEKVFKDECPFSFETPETEKGIYICMRHFVAIGSKILRLYYEKTGCRAFLRYKIEKQFNDKGASAQERPTKLAIGVSGGFDFPQDMYTVTEHWSLVRLPQGDSFDIPNPVPGQGQSDISHLEILELPKHLAISIASIQRAESVLLAEERANSLKAWEDDNICFISSYAMNLAQINNSVRIPPSGWKCSKCDLRDNLWMNLTDGTILCGRKFWDGSGGNNHALEHYEKTKYPLAVKLGTITPKVLFSISQFRSYYAYQLPVWCEEALDQFTSEDHPLLPVDHIGLQFSKLGHGLCSGVHSWLVPNNLSHTTTGGPVPILPGIRPILFRRLMGAHNSTFATKQQQDACEFLIYLLDLLEQKANKQEHGKVHPSNVMRFGVEERLQCGLTNKVSYKTDHEWILSVPVPMEAVTNQKALDNYEKRRVDAELNGIHLSPEEVVRPIIPMEACLSAWAETEQINDFKTPASQPPGAKTFALRSNRLTNFPNYLCIQVGRFTVGTDWLPKKLDVDIELKSSVGNHGNTEWFIDLNSLRAPNGSRPLPGEQLMPTGDEIKCEQMKTDDDDVQPDVTIINDLLVMGFTLEAAQKACKFTQNTSVENATNWLMEHLDDPDLNDPLSPPSGYQKQSVAGSVTSTNIDENAVEMMLAMGFSRQQSIIALQHKNGNLEQAADWALSNPDELETLLLQSEIAMTNKSSTDAGNNSNQTSSSGPPLSDGSSKYELFAFISHMGKSTNDGHYVAHIKRSFLAKCIPHEPPVYHVGSPICGGSDQEWIIFNDEKVAKSECPPHRHAYLYFFRRLDAADQSD